MKIYFRGREYSNDNNIINNINDLKFGPGHEIEFANNIIKYTNINNPFIVTKDLFYKSKSVDDRTAAIMLFQYFFKLPLLIVDLTIEDHKREFPFSNSPCVGIENNIREKSIYINTGTERAFSHYNLITEINNLYFVILKMGKN